MVTNSGVWNGPALTGNAESVVAIQKDAQKCEFDTLTETFKQLK
jgi:hypothetical protein